MTRITAGNGGGGTRNGDAAGSGTARGAEGASGARRGSRRIRVGNGADDASQTPRKPQGRHSRKGVVIAVVVVAAVACGGAWHAAHAGNGTSTVGIGTTTVNADSTNLQANYLDDLHDFSSVKEYTDDVAGGTVTNSLAVGNDDGTAVTVDTKMENVSVGWCGTIVLFDKDGRELGRGDVSMPQDMGGTSETMQYIEVDASQVAYWKMYSTDAVDASADISGIDVVSDDTDDGGNEADDADADSADDGDADSSDAENVDNAG